MALSGPNKLSKKQLEKLYGEMGGLNTYLGSDSVFELVGGMNARDRVRRAMEKRLF